MDKDFYTLLEKAQSGDSEAIEKIFSEFIPLINKYSYINAQSDDDLLGELYLAAYMCILRFKVDRDDLELFLKNAEG